MSKKSLQRVYSRQEVLRLLGITPRELRDWERLFLMAPREVFSYSDLQDLHSLRDLWRNKKSRSLLRGAIRAIRRRNQKSEQSLWGARFRQDARRITVKMAGTLFEPVSGQLLLDFDSGALDFPASIEEMPRMEAQKRRAEAEHWFQLGVEREQTGAPLKEAAEAYQRSLALDPCLPAALVNLGTIYFHAKSWTEAERCYRRAVAAAPDYPLAHFNLANLYDELGDLNEARRHYETALEMSPDYADAHYNLALLFQSSGQVMRAALHWQAYLRLDPHSSWGAIARRQLRQLTRSAVIPGGGKESTQSGVS